CGLVDVLLVAWGRSFESGAGWAECRTKKTCVRFVSGHVLSRAPASLLHCAGSLSRKARSCVPPPPTGVLDMQDIIFVLGAPDAETTAIQKLLTDLGVTFVFANHGGRRVHPAVMYHANPLCFRK